MVQLYNLALCYRQRITGNQRYLVDVLKDTLNTQEKEYDHLLKLANNQKSPQIISLAIRTAEERNQEFKHKYNDLDDIGPSSGVVSEIGDNGDHVVTSTASSTYTTAMEFVKRMDRVGCLSEGKKKGMLHYENSDSLRNQFQNT